MAGIETYMTLVLVAFTATSGFAVTFADGGVHTIDYEAPSVDVYDGPGEAPTTLNVVPGGDIAHLHVHDSSLLNVSGGEVSHVNAHDSTTVTVSAGDISHLRAYDNCTMSVGGVHSFGHVSALGSTDSNGFDPAQGSGVVDVFSGTYFTATARASGVMRFHGGDVRRVNTFHSGTSHVYGGNVTEFLSADQATTDVFGGSISSIWADRNGIINVYGGHVAELRDASSDPTRVGVVNIFGTELAWSGVYGDHVVGILLDQTPIDAPVLLEIGQLELHVIPEPSALILLAAGALVLLAYGWRRKRG